MMDRITLIDVSKKFKIGFKKRQSTLRRVISLFSGKEPKTNIMVLKNISFSVRAGETVGIIGPNGSGKTTLFRVINRVYKNDGGMIKINGKIINLVDIYNDSSKERLSMNDCIYMYCSLLGLSIKTIKKKLDMIIDFSELNDFTNTKISQFSKGMTYRLSFAILVNCNPDILLIDEGLEHLDEPFKNKCLDKLKEMSKKGTSILLTSHDLNLIKDNCDRVLVIDNGKLIKEGNPNLIIKDYLNYR